MADRCTVLKYRFCSCAILMEQLITRKSCSFKLFQEMQLTNCFFDDNFNTGMRCPTKGGLDMNAKQFEQGNSLIVPAAVVSSGRVY